MEYLRETVNSDMLSSLFDLPASLRNRDVEVIILPFDTENKVKPKLKSAKGCLKKYANPALLPQEKNAWAQSVEERYADH